MAKGINISSVQDFTAKLWDAKNPPIPWKEGFIAAKLTSIVHIRQSHLKNSRLSGHARPITAITLSASQDFLISCSADKVILWCHNSLKTSVEEDGPICGTTLGVHLGPFTQCAVSGNNEWVALSKEHEIWIVRLKWKSKGNLGEVEHYSVLPGVMLSASSSSFSHEDTDLLVTVEDSNVFKIWNVRSSQKILQASVLGSHRISFCAFSSAWPRLLLVGSNRGVVHVFKLKDPNNENFLSVPRILFAVDLTRSQNNTSISSDSEPPRHESQKRVPVQETPAEECSAAEAGCIILNAILVRSSVPSDTLKEDEGIPNGFHKDDSVLRSILETGPILIACSNQGIAVYNVNPGECSSFISFSDISVGNVGAPFPFLDYAVLSGSSTERIDCVLRSLGGKQVFSFTFGVHIKEMPEANASVSILASNPVSSNSPLRIQMKACAAVSSCGIHKSASGLSNDARTSQRRKVRSSGYGLPPRSLDFNPRISGLGALNKSLPLVPNTKVMSYFRQTPAQLNIGNTRDVCVFGYAYQPSHNSQLLINARSSKCLMPDQDCNQLKSWKPPLKLDNKILLEEQYGAALHLGVSGDGNQISCSSRNLITVLNANKLNLEDCVSLIGHDNRVNSVAFSLDNAWIVSASDDGSSKVWDWKSKRCVLDIGSNPISDKKSVGSRANRGPRRKVTQASFYYMDHFVVQAVGSHLDLCCHRLHEDGADVLRSSWRLVRRIDLPAQEVTCFSAANSFHSNYIVAGSSNRSLLVYDVDAEKLAISVSGAHSRAPHALRALTGSSKIAQPSRILDLVLSSAICDGVKLWDLRAARCVQKYSRHCNRAHLSGMDVSPCCRYVAVASEDKCVYLYDSRQCHDYLCKLGGFTVPVMDVAFNPSRAQLFAAGLNGSILSFSLANEDKKK